MGPSQQPITSWPCPPSSPESKARSLEGRGHSGPSLSSRRPLAADRRPLGLEMRERKAGININPGFVLGSGVWGWGTHSGWGLEWARTQGPGSRGLSSSDPHSFLWGLKPQPLVQTWDGCPAFLSGSCESSLDGEEHRVHQGYSGGCRVGVGGWRGKGPAGLMLGSLSSSTGSS